MVRSFLYYLFSKDTSLILLIAAVLSWMVGFYSTFSFGDTRIKLMIVTIICLMITSRQRLEAMYDEANEGYHPEELENRNPLPNIRTYLQGLFKTTLFKTACGASFQTYCKTYCSACSLSCWPGNTQKTTLPIM